MRTLEEIEQDIDKAVKKLKDELSEVKEIKQKIYEYDIDRAVKMLINERRRI